MTPQILTKKHPHILSVEDLRPFRCNPEMQKRFACYAFVDLRGTIIYGHILFRNKDPIFFTEGSRFFNIIYSSFHGGLITQFHETHIQIEPVEYERAFK